MSKIYKVDESGVCVSRNLTLVEQDCVIVQNYTDSQGQTFIRKEQVLDFTINAVLTQNLTIYYRFYTIQGDDFGYEWEGWTNRSTVIQAGQTTKSETIVCYASNYEDYGAGGWALGWMEVTQIELMEQAEVPAICFDPLCDLEILSVDITHPEVRGQLGSISVDLLGVSGNTTYKLNGITYTTTGGATYTYQNVPSGMHVIYIEDQVCSLQTYATVLDGDFRTGDFTISEPANLVAAYNPIIHNVGTTQNTTLVQKAIAKLHVQDVDIVDGTRISFNLINPFIYNQVFYARNFPNRRNYFLSSLVTDRNNVAQGSNTREEITQSVGEALLKDNVIGWNYNVFVDGYDIYLTAKQTGTKFNLNETNVFIRDENNVDVLSGITFTTIQNGIDKYDGEIVDNYSIYAEVFLNKDISVQYPEDGNNMDYERVATLTIPFQINNKHIFDVQNVVQNYVNTPKPFFEFSGYTLLPEMMRPYFIKFGETYPIVSNSNTVKRRFKETSDKRWVINSSLSNYARNDMSVYKGTPISGLNPEFDYTLSGYTFNVTDYLLSGYVVTDVNFRLRNETVKEVGDWQTGTTFTIVDGVYLVDVSGTTDNVNFMVTRKFVFTTGSAGQYWDTTYPLTTIPNKNIKFLTNSPNPKQIQRQQQEYLYFVLKKNINAAIKCVGNIYYYDGSIDEAQTFFQIETLSGNTKITNAGGVFVLNLSYDKLGLADYEINLGNFKKIKYVDVKVVMTVDTTDLDLTITKRYAFNINEQPRKFGVIFENRLGGYDSFDFVGVVENEVSREYGEYTITTTPNNLGALPQGFKKSVIYNSKITREITANTGFLNKEHLNWLKEMLSSNNVYDYTEDNQHYLKIVDYKYLESSQEDIFDMEVTFRHTYYENNTKV